MASGSLVHVVAPVDRYCAVAFTVAPDTGGDAAALTRTGPVAVVPLAGADIPGGPYPNAVVPVADTMVETPTTCAVTRCDPAVFGTVTLTGAFRLPVTGVPPSTVTFTDPVWENVPDVNDTVHDTSALGTVVAHDPSAYPGQLIVGVAGADADVRTGFHPDHADTAFNSSIV